MADMIRSGAEWFEGKRIAHMTVPVLYRATDALVSRECDATVFTDTRTVIDAAGQFVIIQTRVFVIAVSQLPTAPRRDDRITITEGGVTRIYIVASPTANDPVWVWGDRANLTRKITATPV